jgi:hypothetical protein
MTEFGLWVAPTKAAEAELKAEMRALPIAEMEVPVRSWRFGKWAVVVRVRSEKRIVVVRRCIVWLFWYLAGDSMMLIGGCARKRREEESGNVVEVVGFAMSGELWKKL